MFVWWFTAAARCPPMLLPRWLFLPVKGKRQGKSESQCPHWEFWTSFSRGGVSLGSCCNVHTLFSHVLRICFILNLERHFPRFLVTVASTDKVLSKKMRDKWPHGIGLKYYVSVTISLGLGTLCFPGPSPKDLGCTFVLHHSLCGQKPQFVGWQAATLRSRTPRFATGQPSSYIGAWCRGLKWWHPLLQCHPPSTKVFCGASSFKLVPEIVTD